MKSDDGWIVIPNWAKFQHYPDNRGIIWVKDYLDQLDRDDYGDLTLAERGLLLDLRKLYARRRGLVRSDTKTLSRALTVRVTQQQLDSLNDAGFIEIVARRPLALRALARREEEERKKTPARTRAKKPVEPGVGANVIPADPVKAIEAMIRNGVIHDEIDLQAEIAGYHLNGDLAARLFQMLGSMP
jgi:hypothetical protein